MVLQAAIAAGKPVVTVLINGECDLAWCNNDRDCCLLRSLLSSGGVLGLDADHVDTMTPALVEAFYPVRAQQDDLL